MNKSHSRKPKVLNVGFHPPPPGGMAIFINNFEKSEIKDSFDLRGFDTDYPRWLKRFRPLTVLYLPIMYLHYIWILTVFKPDIVHIHTPAYNSFYKHILFLKITRERNIPAALHIHAGKFKEFYDNLKKSKQRDVCRKLADANLLIVLSNYWKEFFTDLYSAEKIRVVENGILVDIFCPLEDKKQSAGNKFLYVGRVLQQKGMDELLEACHQVFKIHPDAHLTIAGGEDVAKYSSKAEKMGISKNVTFTGEIVGKTLIELYQKSDIFVLPSHAEGMPLVLLEAMSTGLACIATDVGAIPEVLKPSGGSIIPPKDVDALRDAMLHLVGKPDIQKEMGEENREIINRYFSFSNVAENMKGIYDEMIINCKPLG